jgi:hypothetical protein
MYTKVDLFDVARPILVTEPNRPTPVIPEQKGINHFLSNRLALYRRKERKLETAVIEVSQDCFFDRH